MTHRQFAVVCLAGASSLAFPWLAKAQTAPTPAASADEVVVTGSRVIKNGNNSPTPVTVVSTEQLLESQPTTIAAALQNLPVFQGSMGQNTGTGGGAAGPNGTADAVNIRNLGLLRTLVLMDGHRVQSTSDTGVVTIDLIPQMLLQRVDVVTGGSSAVYGSDAISGVVNFVTDTHFNGLKLTAQRGISQLGDEPINDVGLAWGTNLFGGRGHFEMSLEYHDDPGVPNMFSRQAGDLYALEGAGTAANPYKLYSNVRVATATFGGEIRSGPLTGETFDANGVLSPFNHGAATGTSGIEVGGDGGYYFNTTLEGSLEARRGFGRFDYDVTNDIHFYAEALGALNGNMFRAQSLGFTNVTLSSNNPFLPASVAAQMPANSTFTLSKIPMQLGPNEEDFKLSDYQFTAGLDGDFAGYKWSVGGAHGYALQNEQTPRNINYQKLYAALDAVKDPSSGNIVCRVTLTNPTLYPGCAPLNPFGPTSESPAALAYITDVTQNWATTTLDEAWGSITGAPFSTWAGPVNAALSGEWRESTFFTASDVSPLTLQNCTGLVYNCSATSPLHQITFRIAPLVSQSVKEAALEADVPLVKDVFLARSIELNLAGRYADYDVFGGAWTYKVGLDWHVNEDLTLRATNSRDFRAPNLNDLYAPETVSHGNVVDQLTGATLVSIGTESGGNANLKPEVGDTRTAGFVYQPHWLPGSSLSFDAYDIKITNAISGLSGATASIEQQCDASGGTSPLCQLIVRPLPYSNTTTANNATLFYNESINAAFVKSWGADIEANYATRFFSRPLSLRALITWQPENRQVTPGISDLDSAGATTPVWRMTAFLDYKMTDQLRVDVTERWRSAVWWNADRTVVYALPSIPAFAWTDLNLTYSPTINLVHTEVFLNIQNLFNQIPPIYTTSTANPGVIGAYYPSDNVVGRYFTLGVRFKF